MKLLAALSRSATISIFLAATANAFIPPPEDLAAPIEPFASKPESRASCTVTTVTGDWRTEGQVKLVASSYIYSRQALQVLPLLRMLQSPECQDCRGHWMTLNQIYCGCAIVPPYCEQTCYGWQTAGGGTYYGAGYKICTLTTPSCGTCSSDQLCPNNGV